MHPCDGDQMEWKFLILSPQVAEAELDHHLPAIVLIFNYAMPYADTGITSKFEVFFFSGF